MPKRRTIAAAIAALLCLTFCGLEVALRMHPPRATNRVETDVALEAFGPTVMEQYPMLNHQTYFALEPDFDGSLWKRRFRTNSLGLRGPEITREKAPQTVRIVLFGTCITLGELDETEDGYSALATALQDELQAGAPDISFEVINASVPGAYASQHLAHYEAVIEPLEPDVVLVEAGTMHVTDPARMLSILRDAPHDRAPLGHVLARPMHDFFARSALIRHLYDLQEAQAPFFERHFRRGALDAEELRGKSQEELVDLQQTRVLEPGAKLYRRELSKLLTKIGAQAHVVTYPFTHSLPRTLNEISFKRRNIVQRPLVRDAPPVYSQDPSLNLALFHRSNDIIQESTVDVVRSLGALHVDLQRDPELIRPVWHNRRFYYLTWESGSAARGRALARYLLQHHRFELRDGRAVVERRDP